MDFRVITKHNADQVAAELNLNTLELFLRYHWGLYDVGSRTMPMICIELDTENKKLDRECYGDYRRHGSMLSNWQQQLIQRSIYSRL